MSADLVIQICNIQLSISQKIPTIPPIRPSPLVCGGKMAISRGYFCLFHYTTLSEIPFFCLKQSQGFEDLSSTQSLPKLPFSVPPVQKTKLHYTRWLLRRS